MSTPDAFDPYRKWLGIPPQEQPPNHYRLLGVGLFEDDADTIAGAADRQMAHVRTFQTGPHSAISQKLLNELAAARIALLDLKKKAAYDEQLRAKLTPQAAAATAGQGRGAATAMATPIVQVPIAMPRSVGQGGAGQGSATQRAAEQGRTGGLPQAVAMPVAVSEPLVDSPSRNFRRRRSRQDPAVWLGLAVAGVAVAGGVYYVGRDSPPATVVVNNQPATISDRPSPETKAADGRSNDLGESPDRASTNADDGTSEIHAMASGDTSAKGGPGIDLLSNIDPTRDAVQGSWQLTSEGLLNELRQAESTLQVGTPLPQEYVLKVVVERREGTDVELGLVVDGHQVMLAIDAYGGKQSGLHMIEGQQGSENETTHYGPVLAADAPSTIECKVRKNRVVAAADGQVFLDWQGDPSRFSLFEPWRVPDEHALIVGASHSSVLFKQLELTPLEPESMPAEKPPIASPEKPRTLAALATAAQRPGLTQRRREPPPEGKALAAANIQFAQLYGKEVGRAKTLDALRDLAIRQLNLASLGEKAADIRYVMLTYSGTVAANQGNLGVAYRVAAEAARQFDVDGLSLKTKALDAAAKNAQSPQAYAIGALQALSLAERAVAEGKFDVSAKAAGQATSFARKAKDKDLTAEIDQGKAALRERSSRNAAYKKALADLKKMPDDRAAKLTAGKFEVLVLGDWKEGLGRLAASGDERFVEVAGLEAEARLDPSQWMPLAAAWWKAAEQETDEFFRAQCRLQAKYCWLRGQQSGRAGGLSENVVEQLRTLPGYPLSRLVPGVAARYYDGDHFQRQKVERAEDHVDFHYGEGSPDPLVPTNFFTARWTGFIKPPVTGRYQIVTFTNDSIRLWIDGQQVLNRWGQAAGWQQVELELTDEPHTLRMDYNDTFEVGTAMLGWTLAAFPDEQHVQWSPVDALYYDPESPFELPELK